MTEVLIRADSSIGGDSEDVRVGIGASNTIPAHLPRRVPFFIPRDEAYYWTHEWQEGVRRSMADLVAGRCTDFDPDDSGAFMRRFVGDEGR